VIDQQGKTSSKQTWKGSFDGSSSDNITLFTFRDRVDFHEDHLCRHIEAPHAFYLDLPRLSNFNITLEDGIETSTGNVHLYRAIPANGKGNLRYFARLVNFNAETGNTLDSEALFMESLDALALAKGRDDTSGPRDRKTSSNHIFLNIVVPDTVVEPDFYENELRRICTKYSEKMANLSVSNVELKLTCRLSPDTDPMQFRLHASNPTGFVLKIDYYYEAVDNGVVVFRSVRNQHGELNGLPISTPYPVSRKFESQRAAAAAATDTLYVYDWPLLFERAVEEFWESHIAERSHLKKSGMKVPHGVFNYQELVLCESEESKKPLRKGWTATEAQDAVILPFHREPGVNDTGMVAWIVTIRLPTLSDEERKFVLIANDITFNAGSFGTTEDIMFFKASQYAREHGLPRLYLAANSGARIGMAQSLKNKFEVCWTDPEDPAKGYKYIYVTDEIYQQLLSKVNGDVNALPLICSPVTSPDGSIRHMITDIIGEEADLGVENLMGSGMIAGETSRAYNDIFTLTLVVGRTVGIGAYLVRLGQRTIQNANTSPIILTGYQALNKLMGRDIYTTNDQLGGPMIMFPNGVSHLLAESHMDSVKKSLTWLSFVPATKSSQLPITDIYGVDVIDRAVECIPKKGIAYDPRHLLCGVYSTTDHGERWIPGFFDKNSYVGFLEGWAKTVVVGRARLGGIPIGVIVTENRTAEAFIPADPADATSQEKMLQQAGGVWFPDSAFKTAQVLFFMFSFVV
jgi:acetyl-CoA carboxylase/biotin carboxylase 1